MLLGETGTTGAVVTNVKVNGDREIVRFSCEHQLTLRASPFHRFRIGDRVECQECRYNLDTPARRLGLGKGK